MDGLDDHVISRRAVLGRISLALGALILPPAVHAQEPGRTYRLGALFAGPWDAPQHVALVDELRRVGFVLGQNLNVDTRGYGLGTDRFPDFAREMVNAKVDVILCGGNPAIRAAQQATATIPILAITDDPSGRSPTSGPRHPMSRGNAVPGLRPFRLAVLTLLLLRLPTSRSNGLGARIRSPRAATVGVRRTRFKAAEGGGTGTP